MRHVACAAAVLMCANLDGQNPPARPQVEVASVKPAANDAAGPGPMMREIMRNNRQAGVIPMEDPGRIRLDNWALLDLIAAAYRVRAREVSGPPWLADRGFDIEAKTPKGTQKEQLNGMLQSLLEEKVHHNSQIKQGFALVIGKGGPKLKPAGKPLTPEQRQEHSAANRKRIEERGSIPSPSRPGRTPTFPAEPFSMPSKSSG